VSESANGTTARPAGVCDAVADWPMALAVGAMLPTIPITVALHSALLPRFAELGVTLPVVTMAAIKQPLLVVLVQLALIGLNVLAVSSARKPRGAIAIYSVSPLARFGSPEASRAVLRTRVKLAIATAFTAWAYAVVIFAPLLQALGGYWRAWPSYGLVGLPAILLALVQLRHLGPRGVVPICIGAALVPLAIGATAMALTP
jgi:hypothetical protein